MPYYNENILNTTIFSEFFFYLIGDGVPDICINIGYESMANSETGGRIDNQETSMAIMSKSNMIRCRHSLVVIRTNIVSRGFRKFGL